MKVKIKEEIYEVPNYFEVRENKLYNRNTQKFEGVEGDIVTVTQYGTSERGHVKGYTEYQIVPTHEWPTRIVSACGLRDGSCAISFLHQTPVTSIEKREE